MWRIGFWTPGEADNSGDYCIIVKVENNPCHTEEVEPGKFFLKCKKTLKTYKACLNRPAEMIESEEEELPEEDVTEKMLKDGRLPTVNRSLDELKKDFLKTFGIPIPTQDRKEDYDVDKNAGLSEVA